MTLLELKQKIVKAEALISKARDEENADIRPHMLADVWYMLYTLNREINEELKNNGNNENENNAD